MLENVAEYLTEPYSCGPQIETIRHFQLFRCRSGPMYVSQLVSGPRSTAAAGWRFVLRRQRLWWPITELSPNVTPEDGRPAVFMVMERERKGILASRSELGQVRVGRRQETSAERMLLFSRLTDGEIAHCDSRAGEAH